MGFLPPLLLLEPVPGPHFLQASRPSNFRTRFIDGHFVRIWCWASLVPWFSSLHSKSPCCPAWGDHHICSCSPFPLGRPGQDLGPLAPLQMDQEAAFPKGNLEQLPWQPAEGTLLFPLAGQFKDIRLRKQLFVNGFSPSFWVSLSQIIPETPIPDANWLPCSDNMQKGQWTRPCVGSFA